MDSRPLRASRQRRGNGAASLVHSRQTGVATYALTPITRHHAGTFDAFIQGPN